MYKGSLFFFSKVKLTSLPRTGLKFPLKAFALTLFIIMPPTSNCNNIQSCSEQRLKNSYSLTEVIAL